MPHRKLSFTKVTGAGNDFVLIDNRRGIVTRPRQLAKRLCNRRFGIGADGLLLLERSTRAQYRMRYYNADGSDGGMCGNGGRCIARYVVLKRIAPAKHSFEALEHVYEAQVRPSTVTLRMKDVTDVGLDAALEAGGGIYQYHQIDTGSPHAVFLLPQPSLGSRIDEVPVETVGKVLRHHEAFAPAGTNVNFVERTGPRQLRMRTYERGVEAETLACGTGSIACAVGAHVSWSVQTPVTIETASASKLVVSFEKKGDRFVHVELTGSAEVSFEGTIDG